MKYRIEQTLHGYYMGHGLLATSVSSLEANDASLMATLSDWTGYRGSVEEEDNYLTVYPLPSEKYVAFSKTWYAKEMERPGCVWTHTLLVPIEDFKASFDIRNLPKFFKRPVLGQYEEYSKPIDADSADVCHYDGESELANIDSVSFLFCFSVLLGELKGACFGIDRKQEELQMLVLSFLQYLPLGILLDTSVSTGSQMVRKIGKEKFSLQFIPNLFAETLSSGSWKTGLSENDFTKGMRYLYNEACKKSDNSSYLIHIFDKDIEKSSFKYDAVVNLLRLLDSAVVGKENVSYEKVLSYVFSAFPKSGEGELVKANFLGKKVTDVFCSDTECLVNIARTNIEEDDWKYVQLEQRLSNLDQSKIRDLAVSLVVHEPISETPSQLLLYAFEFLNAAEINGLVEHKWEQLKHLIIDNESYLKNEYWLYLQKEHFNEFIQSLPILYLKSFQQWGLLLKIVLAYGTLVNATWAKEIIAHEENAVITIFDYVNQNGVEHVSEPLLDVCFSHVEECLDWLSEKKDGLNNESLLDLMTTRLDPNSKELSSYPYPFWQTLLKCNSKKPSFLSFMFVLSFQQNGNERLELLKKSFDDIYILQSKGKFPEHYWNRIALYVDTIKWVKEWDKCKRLCLYVISFLHQNGYEKDAIKSVSQNRAIRERLMKYWKKTYQ